MNNLRTIFWPNFHHIYIEDSILKHPNTLRILDIFKDAEIIKVNNYKEIFSRTRQDIYIQNYSKKLILAKKEAPYVLKGSPMCENYGYESFYYATGMMNCIYNCEYCYLQGMYETSNIVIFVNQEDYIKEVKKILNKGNLYLSISYDSDILVFEGLFNMVHKWVEFAKENKGLTLEIRTKSTNYKAISNLKPLNNIILAWTLSPKEIIDRYEKGTPSLDARIKVVQAALNEGWNVRICLDPLLLIKDYKKIYIDFIKNLKNKITLSEVQDITIGGFRIAKEYLKRMKKYYPNSEVLNYPFVNYKGYYCYSNEKFKELIQVVKELLKESVETNKIIIH